MPCKMHHKIVVSMAVVSTIAGTGNTLLVHAHRLGEHHIDVIIAHPFASLLSSASSASAFSGSGIRTLGSQFRKRPQTLLMSSTLMEDQEVSAPPAPSEWDSELSGPPPPPVPPPFNVRELPGVTAPLGFFDPLGFTNDATEGKVRFYREVELKHGRVAMLAAVGFLLAEQFHPLWGGNIDSPSYLAFQQTGLQIAWPVVLLAIAIPETPSVFSFNSPFGGEPWSTRWDYEPGNLGFDPMKLKPADPKELKEMQNKELNNGRLAMLAAAGMIAQEFTTGAKLF